MRPGTESQNRRDHEMGNQEMRGSPEADLKDREIRQRRKLTPRVMIASFTQREKSNIFFSPLTWMPPETPEVSKDAQLSTILGFGGLVL